MCNWAMRVSDACDIILDMLKAEVLKNHLVHLDETTLNVLNEHRRKKSYMWLYKSGTGCIKLKKWPEEITLIMQIFILSGKKSLVPY